MNKIPFFSALIFLTLAFLLLSGCVSQDVPQNQTGQQQNQTTQNQNLQDLSGVIIVPGFTHFDVNATGFCGNTVCAGNETAINCCADCGCSSGQTCWNNSCMLGQNAPNKIQLSGNGFVAFPKIGENFVTWHERISGVMHIMAYNIKSLKAVQLTRNSTQRSPDTSGSAFAWLDQRGDDERSTKIYYSDFRNGVEGTITSDDGPRLNPVISGKYVGWRELVGDNFVVMLFDVSTNRLMNLSISDYSSTSLDISGDYAVWGFTNCENIAPTSPCKHGFVVNNLKTGKSEKVLEDIPDLYPDCISVYGNSMAYVAGEWNNTQIHLYNITSRTDNKLTDSRGNLKMCPMVSGSMIVWQDNRNGNFDIYYYDLAKKEEKGLVVEPGDQIYPDIYGNKVVYLDLGQGTRIFMYVMSS